MREYAVLFEYVYYETLTFLLLNFLNTEYSLSGLMKLGNIGHLLQLKNIQTFYFKIFSYTF